MNNMIKVTCNNDTITLEGRVDSSNAAELEAQLRNAYDGAITIDAKKLEYISSAGLRVLMKLRKARREGINVINVSPDVYEIFEMTGFTDILNVHKRLREIDIDGCDLIRKRKCIPHLRG